MEEASLEGRRGRPSHESHYGKAKHALEDLAVELSARGDSRLPSEDRLADVTGFSRATIRSALLAMQMEGKLLRLHGVGTFINRHVFDVRANLAEDLPFLEVIQRLGYDASLSIVQLGEASLPPGVAARCGTPTEQRGIVIDRLFRASGQAVVFSRDYVPRSYVTAPMQDLTAERSTFGFLRHWTERPVRYSVARVRAVPAPDHVADALELEPSRALLLLDHVHIGEDDVAVGVTEAYVNDDLIDFAVVRTGHDL